MAQIIMPSPPPPPSPPLPDEDQKKKINKLNDKIGSATFNVLFPFAKVKLEFSEEF